MKEILLNEIIEKNFGTCNFSPETIVTLKVSMREACRQALEMASEEAKIDKIKEFAYDPAIYEINKDSILKLIDRVK